MIVLWNSHTDLNLESVDHSLRICCNLIVFSESTILSALKRENLCCCTAESGTLSSSHYSVKKKKKKKEKSATLLKRTYARKSFIGIKTSVGKAVFECFISVSSQIPDGFFGCLRLYLWVVSSKVTLPSAERSIWWNWAISSCDKIIAKTN